MTPWSPLEVVGLWMGICSLLILCVWIGREVWQAYQRYGSCRLTTRDERQIERLKLIAKVDRKEWL